MNFMKNVKISIKLRRLVKSVSVSTVFLMLGIGGSAFKIEANDGDIKNSLKEKTETDKYGFKSLFSTITFDPARPYVTQINPKAIPFVQEYIRRSGESLEKMKIWGKPYFDMYDGIFNVYGLPKELKYLSVIESDLIPHSVSVAGAVGPWQIMPSEARSRGLTVNGRVDERTNFKKSTHAASKILRDLYSQFNDWLLVIAAYNCGAGRLKQAIKKSGSFNFWDLQSYLPLETRNHVKRFIGTHYIFEGSGGLTTMTADEVQDYNLNAVAIESRKLPVSEDERTNTSTIEVAGKYLSLIVAKNLGMDIALFNKLNPNFDKLILAGNIYTMRLPVDKIILFGSKKNTILSESVQHLLAGITSIIK